MVLQGGPCGRVGHRRTSFQSKWPPNVGWPFRIYGHFRVRYRVGAFFRGEAPTDASPHPPCGACRVLATCGCVPSTVTGLAHAPALVSSTFSTHPPRRGCVRSSHTRGRSRHGSPTRSERWSTSRNRLVNAERAGSREGSRRVLRGIVSQPVFCRPAATPLTERSRRRWCSASGVGLSASASRRARRARS